MQETVFMFEQAFKNIDDVLWKEAGCTTELDYTEQVGVYELYLQGRYHWGKRNVESLRKSLEYFQEAATRDAGFAPAHAGLADSYALLGNNGGMAVDAAFPRSRAEAMLALRLNDRLARTT